MATPGAAGSCAPAAEGGTPTHRRSGPSGTGDGWISRKITTNGIISVAWQEINCGKHRAGRRVDIHLQGRTPQIWDSEELLKTVLRTKTRR